MDESALVNFGRGLAGSGKLLEWMKLAWTNTTPDENRLVEQG